jgi:hypothetical protein
MPIASVRWDKAHLRTLNTFGKADVAQLLTEEGLILHAACACVKADDIGEFTWADLQGNGSLELVATMDVNGRAFFNALFVWWRDSSGNVVRQAINGWMISDLHAVIRDLNGDGRDELIIPSVLLSYSTAETITWPAIYKLRGKQYLEASKDFAGYYETEVLPALEADISDPNLTPDGGLDVEETRAARSFEKFKILRVIGRDPTAGLEQAYRWMKSGDPYLLLAATATFSQIPGHDSEARKARIGYDRSMCGRDPEMAQCRNLVQP